MDVNIDREYRESKALLDTKGSKQGQRQAVA